MSLRVPSVVLSLIRFSHYSSHPWPTPPSRHWGYDVAKAGTTPPLASMNPTIAVQKIKAPRLTAREETSHSLSLHVVWAFHVSGMWTPGLMRHRPCPCKAPQTRASTQVQSGTALCPPPAARGLWDNYGKGWTSLPERSEETSQGAALPLNVISL